MALTVAAFLDIQRDEAIEVMRERLAAEREAFVYVVVFDEWKQPYPRRVIKYPVGEAPRLNARVSNGVRCVAVMRPRLFALSRADVPAPVVEQARRLWATAA